MRTRMKAIALATKFDPMARGRFLPFPVVRYGHCNFTQAEVLGAFAIAVAQP